MPDELDQFFKEQHESSERQQFRMAMEGARNAMRAALICVQEGEYDEAERLIKDALGDDA